jgi:hypothetical protein
MADTAQAAQTARSVGLAALVGLKRRSTPRSGADVSAAGTATGTARDAATVVEVLADPGLVDEVAMVVAATGRRFLRGLHTGPEGAGAAGAAGAGAISGEDAMFAARVAAEDPGRSVVLISDTDADRCRALCRALEEEGTAVRLLRVGSGTGTAGGHGTAAAGAGRRPRRDTRPGRPPHRHRPWRGGRGAGTSVFATALAGVAADPASGGCGTALLIDADPGTGGAVGLPAVLGMDRIDGHRWDGAGDGTLTGADLLRRLPHTGEVAVLSRERQGLPAPTVGPVPCPVVVDGGRVAAPDLTPRACRVHRVYRGFRDRPPRDPLARPRRPGERSRGGRRRRGTRPGPGPVHRPARDTRRPAQPGPRRHPPRSGTGHLVGTRPVPGR